jgi:class 3 adenylate cyclase
MDESVYELLDSKPDGYRLPVRPTELWHVATLEIVIRDDLGTYLLLAMLNYDEHDPEHDPPGDPDEGFWSPPFVSHPVALRFRQPSSAGAVRNYFATSEHRQRMTEDVIQLAWQMGLADPRVRYLGSFIELKKSPRYAEHVKCFKIHRYSIQIGDDYGVRNLADPEARLGFVYLPLDHPEEMLIERSNPRYSRQDKWFRGKPIATNVEFLLSHDLIAMRERAIPLRPEHFWREETGLLCVVDLAGYGAAVRYARERMRTFRLTGEHIATELRSSVVTYFETMLAKLGASQLQMAGDGFIAAFPNRVFDPADVARRLLAAWRSALEELEQLNTAMESAPENALGSRIALHYGDYRYGRIGQALSFSPALDGQSIVEVARLEQGLASRARQGDDAEVGSATSQSHRLVVSDSAYKHCAAALDAAGDHIVQTGRVPLLVKEFQQDAREYRFVLSGG